LLRSARRLITRGRRSAFQHVKKRCVFERTWLDEEKVTE
jgi:hypothetical protein